MYKLGTLKLGVQRFGGDYEEITVNPTKEEQVITASSGKDAISKITITGVTKEIDDNIRAENIKKDVEILGVTGTLEMDKPNQIKTATPSASEQVIKADDGFELESVTVEPVPTENKTVKATTDEQIITPTDSKFIDSVIVEPINLQTKTIKPTAENQTLNADEGFDGLDSVIVEAVEPSEYYKEEETATITPTASEQVVRPTENKVFSEVTVEAVPTEELTATENGEYTASDGKFINKVNVNLSIPDLSQTTATENDVLEGKEFFNASGEKVAGAYVNPLQARINETNTCKYLFYYYSGENSDIAKGLDTINSKDMRFMFAYGDRLTALNLSDIRTDNVEDMSSMFSNDAKIETLDISHFNMSKVKAVDSMFVQCRSLKTLNMNNVDMPKVVNTSNMFSFNNSLETIMGAINMISVTSDSNMFYSCKNLMNLTLKNIKINLTIGSGTSYGHLLTLESLLNTIKELHTNTGTKTLTLTMGTANTAKLADVYVKLIDITEEMRAEDEYIDNKSPFEVCESTDEGAMLITEYVTTVKKWQLA